jgi:hypothetical protein
MLEVYLDEAGYTGSDLVNREQPVYALAAVALSDDVAQDLVARCFPGVKARELKHSALSFKSRGRQRILDFVRALSERPNSASVVIDHKECVLVGMLVDFWIESAMHLHGADLYERGANIGLMNVTHLTLGALRGDDGRREFLRRFQVMVRDRTVFAYESFWSTVDDIRQKHPRFDDDLFGLYAMANARLGGLRHLWSLPEHLLDLGDHGFLQTVSHWREKTDEPIRLIHDEAAALVRNRARWTAILSKDVPPAIVGQDRRTTRFPLDASLDLASSAAHVQLQLADILAGAATALVQPSAGRAPKHPDYVEALRESPLMEHCLIGGVWPTAMVTPEELETEGPVLGDAASHIGAIVARAQGREPQDSDAAPPESTKEERSET